jgi:hypothetical protein
VTDFSDIDERWLIENGLYDIADPSHLYQEIVNRRERGDDGIQSPVSKLVGRFSLPLRGITIFGAYSGTGKSSFAAQWGLHAANSGRKTAIMSLEMPPDFTLELLAEQASCKPDVHLPYIERFSRWADQKLYLYSSTDVVTPDRVFEFVRVARTMLGCELIVIDPLMQIALPSEPDAEREFITRLASMSRDLGCAILLVHHLRKSPSGGLGERQKPDKSSFLGSTHLTGAAAAVCTLWCCPDLRELRTNGNEIPPDAGPEYLFTVHKQRFAPWHGSVSLTPHARGARLLCNSTAGQYRPIRMEEELCQSEKHQFGAFSQEVSPSGSLKSQTPDSTPKTDTTGTLMEFPSSLN